MDRERSHQHHGHEGHQNCTGDHEHEELLTIEEASDLFNSLSKVWISIEEEYYHLSPEQVDQQAQEISKVERAIISENIFSENEPFEEILPEHLKYLLLPYVRGKLHMNGQKHREQNIKLAKKYLLGYLGLCEHYEILPKIIQEILDPLAKDQYKSTREQKVAVFRATKTAEAEAEEAQVKVNQLGKDSREYIQKLMVLKCFKAVADIEFIPQELEMLAFKKQLETDPEVKKVYDAEMNKPRPKPYFVRYDEQQTTPGGPVQAKAVAAGIVGGPIVNSASAGGGFLNMHKTKLDVQGKLWQPDHAQPKMTMDQHADLEIEAMYARQDRDAAHKAAEDEKMSKLNEDEKEELERLKTSAWDDWKDANEKGAGNKNR